MVKQRKRVGGRSRDSLLLQGGHVVLAMPRCATNSVKEGVGSLGPGCETRLHCCMPRGDSPRRPGCAGGQARAHVWPLPTHELPQHNPDAALLPPAAGVRTLSVRYRGGTCMTAAVRHALAYRTRVRPFVRALSHVQTTAPYCTQFLSPDYPRGKPTVSLPQYGSRHNSYSQLSISDHISIAAFHPARPLATARHPVPPLALGRLTAHNGTQIARR